VNGEDDHARQNSVTASERDWLASVEAEWKATTPGPWYAHLTDDRYSMTAAYVSTEPGEKKHGFVIDS
jgi:hypothetical protein